MNNDNQKGDAVILDGDKFKSVYFNNTKDMLDGLNAVSKSFCLAKWFHVSLHIPTGRTQSCYHPPTHKIPREELLITSDALHNTNHKKDQRRQMLDGERPSECSFCWAIEDAGNISDRPYRSFDVNEPGVVAEALKYGATGNPPPKYLEVNFNQSCNFKCSYCSPHLSTEWHKEIKQEGAYFLSDRRHNDVEWMETKDMLPNNSPDNPYLLAFWEWFPTVYDNLNTFRMTGGEPLMDRNTFRVFEYVQNNPSDKLHLSITSNCNPPGNQWQKFIDGLKVITDARAIEHFMLFCSLDAWGPQSEYIRHGLHFPTLQKNVHQYLTESDMHSLTFIITANVLSLPTWVEYFENILKMRQEMNTDRQLIWFDTPMLHDPKWMSLKLASKEMLQPLLDSIEFMEANIEKVNNRFKCFKDYEIDKVRRLYEWAIVPMSSEEERIAKKNFHLFFTEHDKRRGTNILTTFPTMAGFINGCNYE